jgi:hypothetical protein
MSTEPKKINSFAVSEEFSFIWRDGIVVEEGRVPDAVDMTDIVDRRVRGG